MDYLGWAGLLVTFLISLVGLIKAFRTSPPEKADAMATLQEMLGVSLEQQTQLREDVDNLQAANDRMETENKNLGKELEYLRSCYDALFAGTSSLVAQLEAHNIVPAWRPNKEDSHE